ncbi:hypothetical protein BD770DRAFT_446330 [Pilaira anomala]|nr:hypothetical protein BD770DRAFT_446330 [Pilaira anomala]
MVELLTRKKSNTLSKLMIRCNKKPIITTANEDPYMPHIKPYESHSTPVLTHPLPPLLINQNPSSTNSQIHHHHHHYYLLNNRPGTAPPLLSSCLPPPPPLLNNASATTLDNTQPFYTHSSSYCTSLSSPLSSLPPPLSPNLTRTYWRTISRRSSSNRQPPAPSISSSEEEEEEDDDDDNQPIGLQFLKSISLLSDDSEYGDDELIPIAGLISSNTPYMSAAEKYKAKVKARLFNDLTPISSSSIK